MQEAGFSPSFGSLTAHPCATARANDEAKAPFPVALKCYLGGVLSFVLNQQN